MITDEVKHKAESLANIVSAASNNPELGKQILAGLITMYEWGEQVGFVDGMKRGTDVAYKTQEMIFGALSK